MSSGRDVMLETQGEAEERDFMGRPTKYDPSYCAKVVELGKQGKSIEQIAGILNVAKRTLYNWRDAQPDFLHALEEAHDLSMMWWEDQAQSGIWALPEGEKINASLWSRSMAARFPAKYRENIKQEITGADGAALLSGLTVNFVKSDDKDDTTNN